MPLHTRFDESGLLAGIRLISIHLLGESIANVALKEREKVSEHASIWEHASFRVGTLRFAHPAHGAMWVFLCCILYVLKASIYRLYFSMGNYVLYWLGKSYLVARFFGAFGGFARVVSEGKRVKNIQRIVAPGAADEGDLSAELDA